MRLIIKQSIDGKQPAQIFCVGDIACENNGQFSSMVLEKMKSEKIAWEVDAVEIIEKYYRHLPLMQDVKSSRYYEAGNLLAKKITEFVVKKR